MLFPVLLIFVVAALLLLICVGCTWLEQRKQSTKRERWLSSHHDSGWSDTTHVLDYAQHKQAVEHYGDAADWWSGSGGGSGGDCCGDGGGGDGGGGD